MDSVSAVDGGVLFLMMNSMAIIANFQQRKQVVRRLNPTEVVFEGDLPQSK